MKVGSTALAHKVMVESLKKKWMEGRMFDGWVNGWMDGQIGG